VIAGLIAGDVFPKSEAAMCRFDRFVGHSLILRTLLLAGTVWLGLNAPSARAQQAPGEVVETVEPAKSEDASIQQQLGDFLHFAMIGKFEIARSYGELLLNRDELQPLTEDAARELVEFTDTRKNAVETLILLVDNETVGNQASRIIKLIRQAHEFRYMEPDRIKKNIQLLSGSPMERTVALQRLQDSGEYAVPWMLEVLADPDKKQQYPYVTRALAKLGEEAVDPLIAALPINDKAVRITIIETLGELGYPRALPYLMRIAADENSDGEVRNAAVQAFEEIRGQKLDDVSISAAVSLFNTLAEDYYDEKDVLRPDPRKERTNVWYFREQTGPRDLVIKRIEVPRDIHPMVMSMRCCIDSLQLNESQPETTALWLAANFRRESHLGLDVLSEEPSGKADLDPTRPANFLRSIYYARLLGPQYCQIALQRGVREYQRPVALGCVAALAQTAGSSVLIEPMDPAGTSLSEAMEFPALLVRIKAALALGRAAPTRQFKGAHLVVPILASTLSMTEKANYILVDPEETTRKAMADDLRRTGADVAAGPDLHQTMTEVRERFIHADGIFLATDMKNPNPVEAVRQLSRDERFGLTPVVLVVKEGGTIVANRIEKFAPRVGSFLLMRTDGRPEPDVGQKLINELEETAPNYGHESLSGETIHSLAVQSIGTLYQLAMTTDHVFDVAEALRPLLNTLDHPQADLRSSALEVLALLDDTTAQQHLAFFALDMEQSKDQRLEAFTELADSARRFGPMLEEQTVNDLIDFALNETDVALRTASSKAVGALNLPSEKSAEMLLSETKK
jgi:HEAT repeat protein/CheY-like chemotaxis protein